MTLIAFERLSNEIESCSFRLHWGYLQGNSNSILPHKGQITPHLSARVPYLSDQKGWFGFISVFLIDVIVERRRNEIEKSSARLSTFACPQRNSNHVGLLSAFHQQFPAYALAVSSMCRTNLRPVKTEFWLCRTYFEPVSDQKRQVHRLCTGELRRV